MSPSVSSPSSSDERELWESGRGSEVLVSCQDGCVSSFPLSLLDETMADSLPLLPALQWFPVESDSTVHMLSQLTKTIKLALKSTEETRAILRARSGVQRFPVIEWRQRTEDFHRRSIKISRDMAGTMAWSAVDSEAHGPKHNYAEHYPHAPDSAAPMMSPGSNHSHQFGEGDGNLSPYGHGDTSRRGSVMSVATSVDHGEYADANSIYAGYEDITPAEPASPGMGGGEVQTYDDFLARANRQIAKDARGTRDPFVEGGDQAPERPFTIHSRMSSVESISSIMDEKSASPLNKAINDASPLFALSEPFFPFSSHADFVFLSFLSVHRRQRRRLARLHPEAPAPYARKFEERPLHREVPHQVGEKVFCQRQAREDRVEHGLLQGILEGFYLGNARSFAPLQRSIRLARRRSLPLRWTDGGRIGGSRQLWTGSR
jgi:hypothetical protein